MPDPQELMVTRPEELGPCLEYLGSCPRFGFDTEFVGEDTYHPRLCLIQVATPDRLYLIDPLSVGPVEGFWNLVLEPGREVIVHAGREEVRLCRLWTGRTPDRLIDLQLAAGLTGLTYPLGHGTLVNQVLGIQIAKGETLTEWRRRPLTPAQLRYAYDDVRYLLPLWQRLGTDLEQLGRLDWVREECQRLALAAAPDEPVMEKWRKLRGLGTLDRRRLAVVRALYTWREELAARTNRPPRTIVRDDLIVEIARRNPARERDLQVVRGLPRRDLAAIVEVVEAARALPADQCPEPAGREQDPQRVALLTGILNAVLADLCTRRRLAPNLVASTQDVRNLVRDHLGLPVSEDDSPLQRGWRSQHILPDLLAVLEGRRSLRVADPQSDAPLAYEDR
jgi:ribonuclease D